MMERRTENWYKEQLAAANARIAELTAERQRDALDGQAALDEANSRITSYEQQFGEYCKWAKSDVDYWKKRAEQVESNAKEQGKIACELFDEVKKQQTMHTTGRS